MKASAGTHGRARIWPEFRCFSLFSAIGHTAARVQERLNLWDFHGAIMPHAGRHEDSFGDLSYPQQNQNNAARGQAGGELAVHGG